MNELDKDFRYKKSFGWIDHVAPIVGGDVALYHLPKGFAPDEAPITIKLNTNKLKLSFINDLAITLTEVYAMAPEELGLKNRIDSYNTLSKKEQFATIMVCLGILAGYPVAVCSGPLENKDELEIEDYHALVVLNKEKWAGAEEYQIKGVTQCQPEQ